MPNRTYTFKNMMVQLVGSHAADDLTDQLRLCIFHSTICLGFTHCRFGTFCNGLTHGCGFRTLVCPGGSICPGGSLAAGDKFGNLTPALAANCGWGTGCANTDDCGGTAHPFDPRVNPALYASQLRELKADLREAMAAVEAQEKTLADISKPSSLEEVNQLESDLQGALKDVGAMKTQLKGK
jgi:hypothetical protein